MNKSLLLFDRWHPSADFIAFLRSEGFHFVMRVRSKWNLETDSIKTQGVVTLDWDGKPVSARVLKVNLPTGNTETLLTSLNQKQFPIAKASELYFKHWAVETDFDLIKSKLASKKIVECWTQRCRNWDVVLNQLNILFADRIAC